MYILQKQLSKSFMVTSYSKSQFLSHMYLVTGSYKIIKCYIAMSREAGARFSEKEGWKALFAKTSLDVRRWMRVTSTGWRTTCLLGQARIQTFQVLHPLVLALMQIIPSNRNLQPLF